MPPRVGGWLGLSGAARHPEVHLLGQHEHVHARAVAQACGTVADPGELQRTGNLQRVHGRLTYLGELVAERRNRGGRKLIPDVGRSQPLRTIDTDWPGPRPPAADRPLAGDGAEFERLLVHADCPAPRLDGPELHRLLVCAGCRAPGLDGAELYRLLVCADCRAPGLDLRGPHAGALDGLLDAHLAVSGESALSRSARSPGSWVSSSRLAGGAASPSDHCMDTASFFRLCRSS